MTNVDDVVSAVTDPLRGSEARLVRDLLTLAKSGGFTVAPDLRTAIGSGFAVGRDRCGLKFSVNGLDHDNTVRMVLAWVGFTRKIGRFDHLQDGAVAVGVGGWIDGGCLYLDVVDVYPNTDHYRGEIVGIGSRQNQIAVADLDAIGRGDMGSAFIECGGTGADVVPILFIQGYARSMDPIAGATFKRDGDTWNRITTTTTTEAK